MPKEEEKPVIVGSAEFAFGAARADQVPPEGAQEIAFAGRSNVGKSSLLNMLLARKGLARTSRTPGATRQINFFDVSVASPRSGATPGKGPKITFVDLPGYGYAKVSRAESKSWKDLLEGYLQKRSTLRAVVLLVDVRRGIEQEERDLIEFMSLRPEIAVIVAVTKVDKIARSAQKPTVQKLAKDSGLRVIATSAETKAGREELWSRILEKVV